VPWADIRLSVVENVSIVMDFPTRVSFHIGYGPRDRGELGISGDVSFSERTDCS
jgi:hypothetical protein